MDLFVVSIRSGTNLLLGLGVASTGVSWGGIETGVGSGVGNGLTGCLLLLNVVSTGSGTNRRLGGATAAAVVGAKSILSTPPSFLSSFSSFLLLLVVISTGSTANRRTLFTVVSTGVGVKRLDVGGGDDSDIVRGSIRGRSSRKELVEAVPIPVSVNNISRSWTHSKPTQSC